MIVRRHRTAADNLFFAHYRDLVKIDREIISFRSSATTPAARDRRPPGVERSEWLKVVRMPEYAPRRQRPQGEASVPLFALESAQEAPRGLYPYVSSLIDVVCSVAQCFYASSERSCASSLSFLDTASCFFVIA
jgi:hypothetical protein